MLTNAHTMEEMDLRQLKYKKRVARIRKIIKSMVFENAALCDQVATMQETILGVKEERKFLLRKLIEYDADINIEDIKPNMPEQSIGGAVSTIVANASSMTPHLDVAHTTAIVATHTFNQHLPTASPMFPLPPPRVRKPYKKRATAPTLTSSSSTPPSSTNDTTIPPGDADTAAASVQGVVAAKAANKKPKKSYKKSMQKKQKLKQQQQQQQLEFDQMQMDPANHEQPDVQTISIDEHGRPIYPIEMGANLAVYDLGEIVDDRPNYHNEHWLYPIGFVSTRIYGHIKEPQRRCVYTCKITDGGDYPLFEIIPETDMDYAIAGPSPDLCHAALLQTMNTHSAGRHVEVRPNGEWFFGLGHPTVVTLLLQQPNVAACVDFVGFRPETMRAEQFSDATLNYEALQRHMRMSYHHAVPEVKEEPPDQLLQQTAAAL